MQHNGPPSLRTSPASGPSSRLFLLLAISFALVLSASLFPVRTANAVIFQFAIVDPSKQGFNNGDRSVADAILFPLQSSDGIPGNSGLIIDTYFAPIGSTVWIGLAVEEGKGDVTLDSDDYGLFTAALCNDNNGDGFDFRIPADYCVNTVGMGTDRLVIPDAGNSLAPLPPPTLAAMGLAVAFTCDSRPGIAHIKLGQGTFVANFFIVCHGKLSSARLSATATKLEVLPQPGSTAHSVVRLQLFDAFGGIVAGHHIDWSVDRCGIETDEVDTVEEVINVLSGAAPAHLSVGPDSVFSTDIGRSLVFDFDGDGNLEALALAIIHCEPAHVGFQAPGPINVTARIAIPGDLDLIVTMTLNLVGPPAHIALQAQPTIVRCGEKVTVSAIVLDSLGQAVSDNTVLGYKTNAGGTGAGSIAAILGPIAPLSSGIAATRDGVATFFILTSGTNVGAYEIVATATGVFSTPPVTGSVSIRCFVPTPAPAATAAAPAAPQSGVTITPPRTGDGGLRR